QTDRFIVERQGPGSSLWERTQSLPAAGNSQGMLEYSTTDRVATAGLYRYRIAEIDLDGSIHYSPQVEIYAEQGHLLMEAFPNPSQGRITVQADGLGEQRVHLEVIDMLGRRLWQSSAQPEHISWETEIDLQSLPSGRYLVILRQENQILRQSIKLE
ncbi:MAG: T9SS type A sorting domain-containing protein, partial [Bacteroidota bacterium]